MEMSHDLPSRLARFTFTVMMAMAWCGATRPVPVYAAPADGAPDLTPQDLNRAADAIEKGLKAAADFDQQLPRDTFDPNVIVRQTDGDPQKLVEWMRSN